MTRKKVRPVLTEADLASKFADQAFKDVIAANWPGGKARAAPEAIERFAAGALAGAKVYIRDATKPEQETGRPMMSPRREAAATFIMGLQVTYLVATGEQPSYTASRASMASSAKRGPFARIANACLHLIGAPVDDVGLINTLQTRANILNDEKGRPRRKREAKKRGDGPE